MILQFRIAATHVRNRLRQTVVSTLGVALGVGFSIAMAALMEGSQRDFMATLIDAIPHVEIKDDKRTPTAQPASTVYDAVAFRGLRPLEDLRGIRNPTEALASLRDWVDGDIAQRLTGQAVLRYSGQDIGMTLIGVRPKQELLVSNIGEDIRKGDFEDLGTTSNGLVLGDKAAERLGADLGDTVTLTSANGVAKRFKIVGLFHTGITTSDESLAYAPLKAVQILLEKPDIINAITIRLRNIDVAVAIAARAERQLGYKAISWEEANEGLMEAFFVRNVIMFTAVGGILLVAGFGIYNIISTIVHEKARDIAILKSLGFPEPDIQQIFVMEGLVIGVLGALVGSALGFGLSTYLATIKFEVTTDIEMTRLPIYFSHVHYVIASGLALLSAGIAGFVPARKAAALNPVDIIRGAT
ncbi:ABC transporter permease [Roseibium alexandrii]|uniref:ABC-type transport system, involved in lipoprotein release, permease component n=1 Tax=Roseibium alexandrii (strain DSM 17067 / NCIMB 14079 / DFL-11) TaxID=244592 RepID=A0A5E8GYK0_ROSAD|nr:ABC transporter permease [Roseibium alexandrii]EEE44526.1 ABC-type transport system, involved in lipoprotein release, permease component [Roseibium alexandrii DFL-11]